MGYVIVRNDGMLVAPPGQERSYVKYLEEARIFLTREDAQRECCVENERVSSIRDLIFGWYRSQQ